MRVNENLLEEILDCLDEEGSIQNIQEMKKYNSLINLLIDETPIEGDRFRASESTISSEVREILSEIKGEDNLEDRFEEEVEKAKENLGKRELNTYTIRFPLNIKFISVQKPEIIKTREFNVQSVERSRFLNLLNEIDHNELTEFLDDSYNDITNRDFSYWKVEIEALDKRFAIEKLESQLEVLLGKINFATHYQSWTHRFDRGIWPTRDYQLRTPFVYLLFQDGEYETMFYDEDISPRKKYRLTSNKATKFDEIFLDLDPLGTESEDKRLEKGLRSFQKGSTEYRTREAFLHYWRGIEILTLTGGGDSSKKAINRARSIKGGFYERLDFSAEKIADKRNNLVHEGVDVNVGKSDVKYLKNLLESLLEFYLFDSFDLEERKKLLKFSSMEEDDIRSHKEDLEQRLRLAEEIIERKYEGNAESKK